MKNSRKLQELSSQLAVEFEGPPASKACIPAEASDLSEAEDSSAQTSHQFTEARDVDSDARRSEQLDVCTALIRSIDEGIRSSMQNPAGASSGPSSSQCRQAPGSVAF